ncbi:hypothetical protein KIK06_12030 [Nocardiopsis sp. EMB25]|uniref:hypothetical protein n=1 Tax=Nocardiopsis sp. EMB25 TaxID=2835867 RepID=UPI002283D613|nr:hypothetical protein [Nocardiopsis sp. EMB25]MCY9784620.1 hypothetical protein [Nocardiopsis sp. EMB25]
MSDRPPQPAGLAVRPLTPEQIHGVLTDVFDRAARCRLLDTGVAGLPAAPGHPQWLLAELGDVRVTGSCHRDRWYRSDTLPGAASGALPARPAVDPDTDRWRILEVLVFGPRAQIRLGERAEAGWISADAPGEVPDWLRPRDRSFLLQGWNGPGHSYTADARAPLSVTTEPGGSEAVLPVEWADFSGRHRPVPGGRTALESRGTWLTVREYWASDPATGAVGVAFHRLTGLSAGLKPTGPEIDVGSGDEIPGAAH